MEILFDNGTIVAKYESEHRHSKELAQLFSASPYWKWDLRIGRFRAPAYKLYEFLGQLKSIPLIVNETITTKHSPLKLVVPPIDLRSYQLEAFYRWNEQRRRGVVVLPTGAGKTRLALFTISELKVKTLILVPTRVLLHQWRDEVATQLHISTGILGDGQWSLGDITVATYESALRSVGAIGDQFSLVVIDEAHHFLSGERVELMEMLCAPYCLALSATFSYDQSKHQRTLSILGPIVFELSAEDLKGTVLAPYQKILILTHLNLVERRVYDQLMAEVRVALEDFKRQSPHLNPNEVFQVFGRTANGRQALKKLREARRIFSTCDDKLRRLHELLFRFKDRKILIFTATTEVALRISSEFLVFPMIAATPRAERAEGLRLFKEDKISVIVTCQILNEGFDVPSADMAIILGGTRGEREHIQRIGRVLRSAPGKSALVYELVCKDTSEISQWRKRNNHE